MTHAPIVIVLVPLAASLLVAMVALRRLRLAHAIATLAAGGAAALAWALLLRVLDRGSMRYQVAGWEPPFGIELHADALGSFVAAVVASMATLTLAWSRRRVADELERRGPAFYAVASLLLCGLLGMCVTADAFNLFVFLEVASLAGYALVGAGGGRSAVAAYRYLILGSTGASLYLLGVGYLYVATGTLNLADLGARVPDTELAAVALAFIVAGLAIKMGLFPLHAWMPDAYADSPSPTAAFIAPIVTKVMALALIRMLHGVFDPHVAVGPIEVGTLVAAMGAVAAIAGAAIAATQRDLRRLLAWSSVGQMGYIAIGIGIGTSLSIAAAMLHVMNHALMKGALFYVAGMTRARRLEDLAGLTRRMPLTAACLVIAALSLVGVPPLAGFFSKWYLLLSAITAGQPLLAAAMVIASLLAIIYVFRLVEAATLHHEGQAPARREAEGSMLVPLLLCTAAIVVAGALSSRIVSAWLVGIRG